MNTKLTNEFDHIRQWAKDKGIYEKGDPKTQYLKLQEEAGELAKALLKNDEPEVIDALGDCVVVLVNLAKLKGYNLEDCINSAYNVISKRKGKMENGTFVKDGKSDGKPLTVLTQHKNGYYNLPCKHSEIVDFMSNNDIEIDGNVYTEDDYLHLKARPSKTGGVAYIYKRDLNE